MAKVTVSGNLELLFNSLRKLETNLELVRGLPPINVRNWARDESARNPAHNIFYFDAVDKGRRGFAATAATEDGQRPMLHYKESVERWVVVDSVGPSEPRRIRETATATIRDGWAPLFISALAQITGGRPPTAANLKALRKRMTRFILKSWKEATIKNTVLRDTKNRFYGYRLSETARGPIIPLAQAFRIDGDVVKE